MPEFFTTGIGFLSELADAALPPDRQATELLLRLARRHHAMIGGSLLARDADGDVRNAYHRTGAHAHADRASAARAHRPGDNGFGLVVGALVASGRGLPLAGTRNSATARRAAESFARYAGAPVLHPGHAGTLRCRMPWLPLDYLGRFEGATMIVAADGTLVAFRGHSDGEGIVVAEIEVGRRAPKAEAPERFWLHRRGVLPADVWHYQRPHGRRLPPTRREQRVVGTSHSLAPIVITPCGFA